MRGVAKRLRKPKVMQLYVRIYLGLKVAPTSLSLGAT